MARTLPVFSDDSMELIARYIGRLEAQIGNLERRLAALQRFGADDGGLILLTPSGGIAARSGTAPGSAVCDVCRINGSDQLETTGEGRLIYNIASSAVAGEVYIQSKRECRSDKHIADFEDCG